MWRVMSPVDRQINYYDADVWLRATRSVEKSTTTARVIPRAFATKSRRSYVFAITPNPLVASNSSTIKRAVMAIITRLNLILADASLTMK